MGRGRNSTQIYWGYRERTFSIGKKYFTHRVKEKNGNAHLHRGLHCPVEPSTLYKSMHRGKRSKLELSLDIDISRYGNQVNSWNVYEKQNVVNLYPSEVIVLLA